MTTPIAPVSGAPLRALDRLFRDWRIRKVRPYLRPGCSVLDVGCHDGALFRELDGRIARGVGIDPLLVGSGLSGKFRFISGDFPSTELGDERFDVITFLAVLEHIDPARLSLWRDECERRLLPGGVIVATVPSPLVDHVLDLLARMRLISGMSLEEHHGFDASSVPTLFSHGSVLQTHRRFELGLNNLYVFQRVDS